MNLLQSCFFFSGLTLMNLIANRQAYRNKIFIDIASASFFSTGVCRTFIASKFSTVSINVLIQALGLLFLFTLYTILSQPNLFKYQNGPFFSSNEKRMKIYCMNIKANKNVENAITMRMWCYFSHTNCHSLSLLGFLLLLLWSSVDSAQSRVGFCDFFFIILR